MRFTSPLSFPRTTRHSSTCCGTIAGVSVTPCERSSAEIIDQPSPADDFSSADVGYFLAPCVWSSIFASAHHLKRAIQARAPHLPAVVPLFSCDLVGGRLRTLGAQFDEPEQNLVPLRLQLRDGARSDLGMNAVGELLLHLRGEHRRAKRLPPRRHRPRELLAEVRARHW